MGDITIALLGALVGLLIGWLNLKFQMPRFLRMIGFQRKNGFGVPLSNWEIQERVHSMRVLYVAIFPIGFAVFGALVGLGIFGSGKWVH
jgi:hypothetical protein